MLGRKSPPTKEPFIPRDSRPDLYLNGADQATDGRGAGSILAKQPDRELQKQHKPNDKTPDKEPDTEPPKPNDGEPDTEAPKPNDAVPDAEPPKPNDAVPDTEAPKPNDAVPDTEAPKPNDGGVARPQPGKREGEPGMIGLIEELMRPGSGSSRS